MSFFVGAFCFWASIVHGRRWKPRREILQHEVLASIGVLVGRGGLLSAEDSAVAKQTLADALKEDKFLGILRCGGRQQCPPPEQTPKEVKQVQEARKKLFETKSTSEWVELWWPGAEGPRFPRDEDYETSAYRFGVSNYDSLREGKRCRKLVLRCSGNVAFYSFIEGTGASLERGPDYYVTAENYDGGTVHVVEDEKNIYWKKNTTAPAFKRCDLRSLCAGERGTKAWETLCVSDEQGGSVCHFTVGERV